MTTNKYSIVLISLLIVGCFVAVSCMDKSVNQAEVDETINFQEFQQTLKSVFTEATKRIERTPYVTRNTVGLSLKEAYKDVLGDQANMYQFEQARELAASGKSNNSDGIAYAQTETLSETIIRSAASPAEAIENFEEYLSDESLSDEERIELITGKEFISFLDANSQAVEEGLSEKLIARSGDEDSDQEGDTDVQEDDGKSWWDSWGKCAAGTLGGAITTGGAYCWGGAQSGIWGGPKGAATGCAVGAVVGAVGGALVGAAASC